MTVPPKYVVRFYGNTDYAMQTIGFREITFVRTDQLNDPFDPYIYFITDFHGDYTALIDYVQQHHKEDFQNFTDRFPRDNWAEFKKNISELFTALRKSTFLFSTCGVTEQIHPKDNLYMWSHYANGHRGVAIEYDTALLAKAVSTKNKKLNDEESDEPWVKIDYTEMLPKISCELVYQAVMIMSASEKFDKEAARHTKLHEIMERQLRSKSDVWEREDEWRLMWQNDETNLSIQRLELPDEAITALGKYRGRCFCPCFLTQK